MSELVTTEWEEFVQALARCLSELPSRATLVIAAPGNRYVQFMQYDIKLSAELAGNQYLTEPISATAANTLREQGWQEPVQRREVDNWQRILFWPLSWNTLVDFARSVVYGLHEALGVGLPGDLRAMGWTGSSADLDLSVLGPIVRRGVT